MIHVDGRLPAGWREVQRRELLVDYQFNMWRRVEIYKDDFDIYARVQWEVNNELH